ncbi:MAG: hypothetical protein C0501_08945 [Isosphaera sp.]|nr:hypothetical protein [Isosphaera sp.]
MPVVACPKCPTKLRVPDGSKGNVRCPKCQAVFPAVPAAPAFEVVDDEPAPPPPPPRAAPKSAATARSAAAPPPPPPPPPSKAEFEFDEDSPRKKKRRDEDEEDDDRDRPRKRRRDDEEDEDDRPRSRGRGRRDDDEDDYDGRPRRGRGRRRDDEDDYDDDYDRRPAKGGGGYGPASTGMLLLTIGQWLYVGSFSLLAVLSLIGMFSKLPDGLFAVSGLTGAGSMVLALVGLSFLIAGPARAKGVAIGAVSVAAVHLIVVVICYSKVSDGLGGRGGLGLLPFDWIVLGNSLVITDLILPALIYLPKGASLGGEGFLFALAGLVEVARCIMLNVAVKGAAAAAKDHDAAQKAGTGVLITAVVCGAAALLFLLVIVLVSEAKMGSSAQYLVGLAATAVCVGYALMNLPAVFAAMSAKDSLARLARKARRG